MRSLKVIRLLMATGLLGLMAVFGVSVVTGDVQTQPSPSPVPKAPPVVSKAKSQSGCLVDEAAVEDVQKAQEEISAKRKELTAKETELKAREHDLAEEVKKLDLAREDFAKAQVLKKAENDAKVAKLVETFLNMSPKAASKILSTLDDSLAVAVLTKMDTDKLAKIMNVMDPARSSQLSEMIAGIEFPKARKLAQMPRIAQQTASPTGKGGDRNDAHTVKSGGMESSQSAGQQPSSEKDQKSSGP